MLGHPAHYGKTMRTRCSADVRQPKMTSTRRETYLDALAGFAERRERPRSGAISA